MAKKKAVKKAVKKTSKPAKKKTANNTNGNAPKLPGYDQMYKMVFSQDRPYRLEAFIDALGEEGFPDKGDSRAYWQLLANVWVDAEGPSNSLNVWRNFFGSSHPHREHAMTPEERAKLAALPDEFPVYRGYAGKRGKGISWTLLKDKAEWFARRFAHLGEPKLISGVASKSDVLALFDGRKESEVVIDPDKVRKQKRTSVKPTE